MQSKIKAFFKPSLPAPKSPVRSSLLDGDSDDELTLWEKKEHEIVNTYTRRASKLHRGEFNEVEVSKTVKNPISPKTPSESDLIVKGKTINRKRSYAQLHLELGQSDFILRACSTCGVEYAPGNEDDEKGHKTFHKDFIHGIPFKGWRNERVIHMPSSEEGRIILVLDCDPPFQRIKVQEVIKRMEIELGGGWIYHSRCKVYLFIASQRIVGCLVSEPIKEAFKVISSCEDGGFDRGSRKKKILNSRTLQFGEIIFQRETMKSSSSTTGHVEPNQSFSGAIFCEKDSVPAACGIRAIWVTQSNRRKHTASQLLDAARKSFCMGFVLEQSQLAFSQPTAAGKALATNYTGTGSFLVYKAKILNC